jgi:bifunctional DNA-binding transcriptional regulator/antitoxin component of YhaV-PrlF toxin-antitoxin module
VTIPQAVREKLRLHDGQELQFTIEDGDTRAVITPSYRRLSELVGILPKPKKTLTLEEMDEVIADAAVARYLRAVGRKKR